MCADVRRRMVRARSTFRLLTSAATSFRQGFENASFKVQKKPSVPRANDRRPWTASGPDFGAWGLELFLSFELGTWSCFNDLRARIRTPEAEENRWPCSSALCLRRVPYGTCLKHASRSIGGHLVSKFSVCCRTRSGVLRIEQSCSPAAVVRQMYVLPDPLLDATRSTPPSFPTPNPPLANN
jgi:hypothetical protein